MYIFCRIFVCFNQFLCSISSFCSIYVQVFFHFTNNFVQSLSKFTKFVSDKSLIDPIFVIFMFIVQSCFLVYFKGTKGMDDSKTLAQARFVIGDYIDIAITPPNPGGGRPHHRLDRMGGGGGGDRRDRDRDHRGGGADRRWRRDGGGGGGFGDRRRRPY